MQYNIREIREANKITLTDLSKKANVSRGTLWSMESGREMSVKVSTLERIAGALNVHVSALFKE